MIGDQLSVNDVRNLVMSQYADEPCGVCKKPGGDWFWFNEGGRVVHEKCYKKISVAEAGMLKVIDGFFDVKAGGPETGKWNYTAINARREVEKNLNGMSFKQYIEENGVDALTDLFNTVGVQAAAKAALHHQKARL